MVFPVLQRAALPFEDIIKHHTPQITVRERVSGCWEKIPEDCNGSSIAGKFCNQNGDVWCRCDKSPGQRNSGLASGAPAAAGSIKPNLACLTVVFLAVGLQSFCCLYLLEPHGSLCLQLKHGSDGAEIDTFPNRR